MQLPEADDLPSWAWQCDIHGVTRLGQAMSADAAGEEAVIFAALQVI